MSGERANVNRICGSTLGPVCCSLPTSLSRNVRGGATVGSTPSAVSEGRRGEARPRRPALFRYFDDCAVTGRGVAVTWHLLGGVLARQLLRLRDHVGKCHPGGEGSNQSTGPRPG